MRTPIGILVLVVVLLLVSCGNQPAPRPSPSASVGPTPSPGISPDGPTDISGSWAIQQALTLNDVDSPVVETALRTPGIRGYSLRVAWSGIDGNTALLDAGARTAAAHHLKLSIRFMAGQWTPARVFAAGSPYYTVLGRKVPTPYFPDGSPNTVFEKFYAAEVDILDRWCHANGVHLLHLPWYGQNYAELNNGIEVRSQPGFAYQHWLKAHERLVDIAAGHMAPDLAVEFPLSGYGPLTQASPDLARYIASVIHGKVKEFYVQANGLGPTGSFGTQDPKVEQTLDSNVWSLPIGHGEQLIQPQDYDWHQIYSIGEQNHATYVEVYTNSFNPALPHHARLLQEIAAFQKTVS